MSCPYAHALGVPGQGVHAKRIFGLALNDMLMTIAGGFVIAFLFNISVWKSVLGFFVLGEVLHYVFGTQTAFLKMIGLSPTCTV
jgi:hypothetical protein